MSKYKQNVKIPMRTEIFWNDDVISAGDDFFDQLVTVTATPMEEVCEPQRRLLLFIVNNVPNEKLLIVLITKFNIFCSLKKFID